MTPAERYAALCALIDGAEAEAALAPVLGSTRRCGKTRTFEMWRHIAADRRRMERHRPDPYGPVELMLHYDSGEECEECAEGEGHPTIVCAGCHPAWEGMDGYAAFPCVEFRDIEAAYGVSHD